MGCYFPMIGGCSGFPMTVLGVLKFLFICLEVLLIFNLLIVVHELGHFLAARWRGLVVEKFAVWMGKPLWKKKIGGVEFILGSIPAGGYVALPQLAPMEAMEGKVESDRSQLPPISTLDKIIVAAAGPIFSIGLAFVFAVLIWLIGRPVSEMETTTTIGYVQEGGPAAAAGLQPGDRILSVNAQPVSRFGGMGNINQSIIWNIARSETPFVTVEYVRDGKVHTAVVETMTPDREGLGRRNLRQIAVYPAMTPMIAKVAPNSPAAEIGLKPSDLVVAADGIPLRSMGALSDVLKSKPGQAIDLTVRRDGVEKHFNVTPRVPEGDTIPRIGVTWDDRGMTTLAHPNPFQQVRDSVMTMWETISAVLEPRSGIKAEHLSGPVGIMRLYYQLFEAPDGWRLALWFSVILNVNLALINLLPIPVLDGGHITLAIIEALSRRPINVRVLEIVQSGFALLIIGFMLYVTFYDVLDLPWKVPKQPQPAAQELRFTPTAVPAPPQPAKPE